MEIEKFNVRSYSVSQILGLIKAREIAIPEIQRPFVWKKRQVRDLLDSLYNGYPTGYLIIWKNHNVRLKDGKVSEGKKILIDGQQRVTALMTSIVGIPVINSDYKTEPVKIAFDPFAALSEEKDAEVFAVQDSSHLKSSKYIPDVSVVFADDFSSFKFVNEYCSKNPDMDPENLNNIILKLKGIGNRQMGVIELADSLDIDVVTDIFIRINSKGTALSQGDFVMSKIAADEEHGGNMLRKCIDYYAHMAVVPSFFHQIDQFDEEFKRTEYFDKIKWLKDDSETVYDPDCDDIIRVSFMLAYPRAKLADLVNLLSGRDFETREYKASIIDDTYEKMKAAVLQTVNKYNFEQFMLAIKGAGFVSKNQINSKMALDFAFMLYLRLTKTPEIPPSVVKHLVQRWYVLSVLTGRYTGSPESQFYTDIKQISEVGVEQALRNIEDARLSDNFWSIEIPQNLAYAPPINPTYLVYLAAQVCGNDISLLSNNLSVRDLIEISGDIHHIFPKEYLKEHGYEKNLYNQVANYAYLDAQVNKSIGKRSPVDYFGTALNQCHTGIVEIGSIVNRDQLMENLTANCIPANIFDMDADSYETFLEERRKLMAKKIRKYYESL